MFTSRSGISKFLVVAVCLCLVACTATQILTDINLALNAAEAILPIVLPLLNQGPNPVVSTARVTQILNWVRAGLTGVGEVSACQAQGGTSAVLAACVTSNLAGVVASVPDLAGLPANIANVVQSFASDLEKLLKQYGTQPGAKASNDKTVIHFGAAQQKELSSFRARVDVAKLRIDAALEKK